MNFCLRHWSCLEVGLSQPLSLKFALLSIKDSGIFIRTRLLKYSATRLYGGSMDIWDFRLYGPFLSSHKPAILGYNPVILSEPFHGQFLVNKIVELTTGMHCIVHTALVVSSGFKWDLCDAKARERSSARCCT